MSIAEIIGKIAAAPFKVADLPFRIMREVVDDPEPEEGALADMAKATEKAVKEIFE
jgi:hypothetical protein